MITSGAREVGILPAISRDVGVTPATIIKA